MTVEKKTKQDKQNQKKKKSRGVHDDLEVLAIILQENPGLKARVLDKIRMHRTFAKKQSNPSAPNS